MSLMMMNGHAVVGRAATDLQGKDDVCCHLQRESGRVGQAFSKPCQQCCTSITARSWPQCSEDLQMVSHSVAAYVASVDQVV